eukprot:TRINITY_DN80228_c0_g1_i1.p1 TRINITY_DN80228_c0_g1~~TRINITY_DN80228_c0_g1_i1.p1  ORF type:complete len:139 (-),score=24.73 TRINITY_DN80228_c0_g1_i1:116-532(-)
MSASSHVGCCWVVAPHSCAISPRWTFEPEAERVTQPATPGIVIPDAPPSATPNRDDSGAGLAVARAADRLHQLVGDIEAMMNTMNDLKQAILKKSSQTPKTKKKRVVVVRKTTRILKKKNKPASSESETVADDERRSE